MLSVLMSVTQLGPATLVAYREDVVAFFKAALLPPEQLRS
jgi:hypothetical protein